jgi:hypothetical protein
MPRNLTGAGTDSKLRGSDAIPRHILYHFAPRAHSPHEPIEGHWITRPTRCDDESENARRDIGCSYQSGCTSTISRIPVTAKYFSQIGQIMIAV